MRHLVETELMNSVDIFRAHLNVYTHHFVRNLFSSHNQTESSAIWQPAVTAIMAPCICQLLQSYLCCCRGDVEGRILVSSFLVTRQGLTPDDAVSRLRDISRRLSNSKSLSFHPESKFRILHWIALFPSERSQHASVLPQRNCLRFCRVSVSLYYPWLVMVKHVLLRTATCSVANDAVAFVAMPTTFAVGLLSIFRFGLRRRATLMTLGRGFDWR
jgi:hypothetical protein